MTDSETRRIISADRLEEGVVVKFDDGRCAFYSCALLYATLPQSQELDETELDW